MNELLLDIAAVVRRKRLRFSGFSIQSKQCESIFRARVMGHMVGSWDEAAVGSNMCSTMKAAPFRDSSALHYIVLGHMQ
jgi:hypothetical protein